MSAIKTLDLEVDPDPHWDLDPYFEIRKNADPYPQPW
jgi:hypothetical protein